MLNEGVRVALGTDGTSMNDEDDLFDEMRLALVSPSSWDSCPRSYRPPGAQDGHRERSPRYGDLPA